MNTEMKYAEAEQDAVNNLREVNQNLDALIAEHGAEKTVDIMRNAVIAGHKSSKFPPPKVVRHPRAVDNY